MKIKKIQLRGHPVFKDHTVTFADNSDIPTIAFLVGNNGSGKTKLLDIIHQILVGASAGIITEDDYEITVTLLFSNKEKNDLGLNENEVNYILTQKDGHDKKVANYLSGNLVSGFNLERISKNVFSIAEIVFTQGNLNKKTNKNIDKTRVPKSKSGNLSTEIPRLLLDVSRLDEIERSKKFEEIQGKKYRGIVPITGTRIKRFTDAFAEIYDKQKIFSGVDQEKNQVIFTDIVDKEVGIETFSGGEKQILYRTSYLLQELGNMHGGIILIDEPELGLHPVWQKKWKDFLLKVFKDHDIQIIIATHSPYIFQNLDEKKEICIKVDRLKPESKKISINFPRVSYNPSVSLISYLAYEIPSRNLHGELYELLQIREHKDLVSEMEVWLVSPTGGGIPIEKTFNDNGIQKSETIMTWIRNKIHHGNNRARPNFNENDLRRSIDKMISLLR